MNRQVLQDLLKLDIGYSVEIGKLIIRSLDNGDYAVSFDLERPENSWEEEFPPEELEKAVDLFMSKH